MKQEFKPGDIVEFLNDTEIYGYNLQKKIIAKQGTRAKIIKVHKLVNSIKSDQLQIWSDLTGEVLISTDDIFLYSRPNFDNK